MKNTHLAIVLGKVSVQGDKKRRMSKSDLLQICKYYKGEEECPEWADKNFKLWWGGEKLFIDNCLMDSSFFARIRNTFYEADAEGHLNGVLVDKSISEDKRVLIFFLDLWHGKWFPYGSYDIIHNY